MGIAVHIYGDSLLATVAPPCANPAATVRRPHAIFRRDTVADEAATGAAPTFPSRPAARAGARGRGTV